MSKLVKTGKEIVDKCAIEPMAMVCPYVDEKYLVLPLGLDVLEEMLKDMISVTNKPLEAQMARENISSVFARFKKENGI